MSKSGTWALVALSMLFTTAAEARSRRRNATDPLAGSKASLRRQNEAADRFGLSRLRDAAELERFIAASLLVPVQDNAAYAIDETLGEYDRDRRELYTHARSWVPGFLDDVFGRVSRATGERFRVTALIRTMEYQRRLRRWNPNGAKGRNHYELSSHLTGATVDVSWKDVALSTIFQIETRLRALERAGLIEATRERHNACWHIMVFPTYAKQRPAR